MQVTALLFAILLIGTVVAQTSAPTNWPRRKDVTMRDCLGASCNQACQGFTLPGGVCHTSRRNSSQSEALYCNEAGVCLNMQIYMQHGCDGPTFETRRVSNQCDGDDRSPARWSTFNYLGNNKLQINWNCSSDCVSNCDVSGVVDITTCWNLGRISGTLDYFGPCRWINADRFLGACSHSSPLLSRVSIEEGACFTEEDGLRSATFTCEGAPPPAGKRTVVRHIKKV